MPRTTPTTSAGRAFRRACTFGCCSSATSKASTRSARSPGSARTVCRCGRSWAWRPTEAAPDHSSLTRIRQRLPLEVHLQAFQCVLDIARAKGLLRGKTLAIDATTLEANAAMKSMVRRVTGEDWKAYLRRLAKAEGIDDPSDEDLRRFDRKRKDKKVRNTEWASPIDPDSRIMKMKDGRTHFGYKAEHAVDVESDLVVAAEIYPGDTADGDSILIDRVQRPRTTWQAVGSEQPVAGRARRQGLSHASNRWRCCARCTGCAPTFPSAHDGVRHNWRDRPPGDQAAFYANRRRVTGEARAALSRLRSEFVRTQLRACLRDRGGAPDVAARDRQRRQALPAACGRAQSRGHHARAVRRRDAAQPAGRARSPLFGCSGASVARLARYFFMPPWLSAPKRWSRWRACSARRIHCHGPIHSFFNGLLRLQIRFP